MDTRIYEYFIEIARESSLSRAAENLYISQPALSQRLKQLEDEIGTPLFDRSGNKLSLTKAGVIFLNGAQSIVYIKEQAYQRIRDLAKEASNPPDASRPLP